MSSRIIPALRYRDAVKAIDWLVDAFGLDRHLVVEGDAGIIEHAQLTHETGMIMLGSHRESDYGDLVTIVDASAKPTAGVYVVVDDVDAHARRAREAGADIVLEPKDEEYGGRSYTCRDLEGNVWTFGSYDPWATDG